MHEYFVARQPIFDRNFNVIAYELLFRNSDSQAAPEDLCPESATARVLTTSDDVGLEQLVGNRLAFINLPEKFLLEPELLPIEPQGVVLEVLETVKLDAAAIEGIKVLSGRGYKIAMDDVVSIEDIEAALPHTSIVKLDIPLLPRDQWAAKIGELQAHGVKVLAEKVETEEEFNTLLWMGCDYFQGYFFARPNVVSGRRLPPNKLTMVELLSRINQPEVELSELSALVRQDVALSVRVMNHANSAAMALNRKIESIQEAVIYAGESNLRRWVMLFAIASIDDKPDELVTMSLVRAKFLELLAADQDDDQCDVYFTVGLFSLLDALMDVGINEVLETIGLPDDLRTAITLREGAMGEALAIAEALERGLFDLLNVSDEHASVMASLHQQATQWADETMSGVAAAQ